MGRTVPTQIQLLHDEQEAWKTYRRALRKEDQAVFDELWTYARRHATAASMAARPLPFEAHCLSMLIGLGRALHEWERKIDDFSSREKTIRPCEGGRRPTEAI